MGSAVDVRFHVERIGTASGLEAAVAGLRSRSGAWWLDSAMADARLGRFSFAGAEPWALLRVFGERVDLDVRRAVHPDWPVGRHRHVGDPFEAVRALVPGDARGSDEAGLPFLGGAVGCFGYELAERLEAIALPQHGDLGFADLTLLLVDAVLAFEHATGALYACGLGFGPDAEAQARARARALAERCSHQLGERCSSARERPRPSAAPSAAGRVRARADARAYAALVETAKAAIARGDLYQACLTQRLSVDFDGDPWELYRRLRTRNPAPFGAYLELPEGAVLSSSPERFLRLAGDARVEARPIKGTHAFGPGRGSEADSARALAASAKDRAENLMIVDLYRNDLGRVCRTGSVRVPELFAIERHPTLHQMVSTVAGELAPGRDRMDLLGAAFPPGSMTGAPKIAAMEQLAALEPDRRGLYAGALGYLDARGGMDLSVVIRTILVTGTGAHVHVGGGIVADSDPRAEHQEAMDKARALLEVLGAAPASPRRGPPLPAPASQAHGS